MQGTTTLSQSGYGGSQNCEWRKAVGQCLRILLAALCCQSACPPFQSQDHRLCLVWSVFFPVTTGICRQLLALPGLDELSSLFRDTGLWQCAVYFRLLAPSNFRCKGAIAMFLRSPLEFALS